MLQLQQHVQQAIQQGNAQAQRQPPRQPAQHVAGVVAQQQHTGGGRSQVRPAKGQVLGQAHQQQEEAAQRRAHQQVLHRVHAQPFRRRAAPRRKSGPLGGQRPAQRWSVGAISHQLKQAHGHKGQGDEQQAVFGGAVCQGVGVHRVHKGHAKAVGAVARCGACGGVLGGGIVVAASANAAAGLHILLRRGGQR